MPGHEGSEGCPKDGEMPAEHASRVGVEGPIGWGSTEWIKTPDNHTHTPVGSLASFCIAVLYVPAPPLAQASEGTDSRNQGKYLRGRGVCV